MIIPEPEELPIPDILKGDFGGRKYMLFQNPSPILPLHFDKKYLPCKFDRIQKKIVKNNIQDYMNV